MNRLETVLAREALAIARSKAGHRQLEGNATFKLFPIVPSDYGGTFAQP
jgi:hypothetical protein